MAENASVFNNETIVVIQMTYHDGIAVGVDRIKLSSYGYVWKLGLAGISNRLHGWYNKKDQSQKILKFLAGEYEMTTLPSIITVTTANG